MLGGLFLKIGGVGGSLSMFLVAFRLFDISIKSLFFFILEKGVGKSVGPTVRIRTWAHA